MPAKDGFHYFDFAEAFQLYLHNHQNFHQFGKVDDHQINWEVLIDVIMPEGAGTPSYHQAIAHRN